MKKSGFTLAEVLITLGIIGVVAALTAPQLVASNKNQTNAAKVSVAVSALENAFASAITEENCTGLVDTTIWGNHNLANIGKYLNVSGTEDNANNNNDYITLKSGVRAYIDRTPGNNPGDAAYNNGGTITRLAGIVDIYTDPQHFPGNNPTPGRNRFQFLVGNNGGLYPVGGKDANVYNANTYPLWNTANTCSNVGSNDITCTGRLVEKGYKMDY